MIVLLRKNQRENQKAYIKERENTHRKGFDFSKM